MPFRDPATIASMQSNKGFSQTLFDAVREPARRKKARIKKQKYTALTAAARAKRDARNVDRRAYKTGIGAGESKMTTGGQ